MKKTISIIGASGEVGFKLVKQLSKTYIIKCIVRNKNKKNFSFIDNVEVIEVADIGLTDQLSTAIENSDVIINTGYIFFAQPILEAINLTEIKPKQIIFTGSTGIYTKLPSLGAQQKRDAETFIIKNFNNIPWTIIRPTMIYGHSNDKNISRLIKVLNKTPIMPLIGKGENLIQPVFIDDLIKSFELSILNHNFYFKSFNIGAERPISNKELFKEAAQKLDKKVFFIPINPKLISLTLKILNLFKISPISQEQVQRYQENKNIDLTPFTNEFKFKTISFKEGVSKLIHEMKSQNQL